MTNAVPFNAEQSGSDLIVTSLAFSETSWDPGDQITATYTVQNTGTEATSAFKNGIYMIGDGGYFTLESDSVSGLLPGQSLERSAMFTVPDIAPPGAYDGFILVDDGFSVEETDEFNNSSDQVGVSLGGTPPPVTDIDLTVTEFAIADTEWAIGDIVTATYTIQNTGIDAAGPFDIWINSDGPTNFIFTAFAELPGLAAGESTTRSIDFEVSEFFTAGQFDVDLFVDPSSAVDETDERNNLSAAVTVNVTDPGVADLIVSDFGLDALEWDPGEQITVSYTVENIGTSTAADPDISLFLRSRAAPESSAIKVATDLLTFILPSESVERSFTFEAPDFVDPGGYDAFLWVDDTEVVREADEDNNQSVPLVVFLTDPFLGLTILGRPLSETLEGGDLNDTIEGRGGSDTIDAGGGHDLVEGGIGADVVDAGDGDDTVNGGAGFDTLNGEEGADILRGNAGNDTINGGADGDTIYGGIGADILNGGDGSDTIYGGDGFDTVFGDGDADFLFGNAGDDTIDGGAGDDVIAGGIGADTLSGGANNDRILGAEGFDMLKGGTGNDDLFGNAGDDRLFGEDGNDTLFGGQGADLLSGGADNDVLRGETGADTLNGGAGDDQVRGGGGNDRVDGGAGNDTLAGGAGADVFVFNGGADVIEDLSLLVDRIELDAEELGLTGLDVEDVVDQFAKSEDGDTTFAFNEDDRLVLTNVTNLSALEGVVDLI